MVVQSAEPPERPRDPSPVGVVLLVALCLIALFVIALSVIALVLFTVRCAWEAGAQ